MCPPGSTSRDRCECHPRQYIVSFVAHWSENRVIYVGRGQRTDPARVAHVAGSRVLFPVSAAARGRAWETAFLAGGSTHRLGTQQSKGSVRLQEGQLSGFGLCLTENQEIIT